MFNSLNHFKSVIAHKVFVEPADHNYFVARWMIVHGSTQEFYWQAAQSIEKYLKASLIVNDISTLKLSHDLPKLYSEFQKIFGKLSLTALRKPNQVHDDYWTDESIEKFIARIGSFGHPDSRYGLISWFNVRGDLFKFDQIIFDIRRFVVGLEWIVGEDWEVSGSLETYINRKFIDVIRNEPDLHISGSLQFWNKPINLCGNTQIDVIHAWNFAFLRSTSDVEKPAPSTITSPIGPFRNSYIFLLWEIIQSNNIPEKSVVINGISWLLKNVKISRDAFAAFENRLKQIEIQ